MKPTQEQVIAWARDSGMELYGLGKDRAKFVYYLEAFAALAYEAGRESNSLTNQKARHYQEGYEAGRKDENEACAKVCEDQRNVIIKRHPARIEFDPNDVMALKCAATIRARNEQ